jgi:hypothetical protein
MTRNRLEFAPIAAALALGLCAIAGTVAAVGQQDGGPVRSTPAAAVALDGDKDAAALLREQDALARKGYDAVFPPMQKRQRQGDAPVVLGSPEEVYRWSIRRLEAERALSPQAAGRRAAQESHLKRMIELDQVIARRTEGLVRGALKFETEWYVLEARLWLEQAPTG